MINRDNWVITFWKFALKGQITRSFQEALTANALQACGNIFNGLFKTLDMRQSKMFILSTNIDQKLLQTEFLIDICRQTGDKWQSKIPFLAIFYLCC